MKNSNLRQIWKLTLEPTSKCFYWALCAFCHQQCHWPQHQHSNHYFDIKCFKCYPVLSDTKTPLFFSGLFTFPVATPWIWRLLPECEDKLTDYVQKLIIGKKRRRIFFLFLFKVYIFDISIDYGAFDIQHSIILSQKEYLLYLEKDVVRDKNMYFIALEPEIGWRM